VYARQPFAVSVRAYALPMADGTVPQLRLFQNVPPANVSAPMSSSARTTIVLSAVAAPNGSTAVTNGSTQAPSFTSQAVPYSSATTDYVELATSASMSLPAAFDAAKRLSGDWGAPALFYVRASMTEMRQVSGGTPQTVTINSVAPATATAGTQYEDGLLAVNGRLQVNNALGSEALRLPVTLTAQYWDGSNWLTNSNDNDSLVAATMPAPAATATSSSPAVVAPACTGKLAATAGSTACASGVVTAANAGTALRLTRGKATMVLQQAAPGRLNGSIDYQVTDGASASWLPSTRGRAKFGLYKAPVIYLREVY
jgi:MSHA biogenesis protein MshQ